MNEVIEILSDFTETAPENINGDSRLVEDLGLTSLDLLDVITAFEDRFDLQISDDDIKDLHTVGDAWTYIQENA